MTVGNNDRRIAGYYCDTNKCAANHYYINNAVTRIHRSNMRDPMQFRGVA